MQRLTAYLNDDALLSPAVGMFYPRQCSSTDDVCVLGVLVRLGTYYEIVCAPCGQVHVLFDKAVCVCVGDALAQVTTQTPVSAPVAPKSSTQDASAMTIKAPTDGFICLTDAHHKPYQQPQNVVHPGDVIAVLEFMKIRIEITYDGARDLLFDTYLCADHAPICAGSAICVLR